LTLVLDGDPEVLADRRQKRGVSDVFEDKALEFHRDIRAAFLEIAERAPERCVIINAEQTPDEVLESALTQIEARLGWP
jgi:dTMP kinase